MGFDNFLEQEVVFERVPVKDMMGLRPTPFMYRKRFQVYCKYTLQGVVYSRLLSRSYRHLLSLHRNFHKLDVQTVAFSSASQSVLLAV